MQAIHVLMMKNPQMTMTNRPVNIFVESDPDGFITVGVVFYLYYVSIVIIIIGTYLCQLLQIRHHLLQCC